MRARRLSAAWEESGAVSPVRCSHELFERALASAGEYKGATNWSWGRRKLQDKHEYHGLATWHRRALCGFCSYVLDMEFVAEGVPTRRHRVHDKGDRPNRIRRKKSSSGRTWG